MRSVDRCEGRISELLSRILLRITPRVEPLGQALSALSLCRL